MATLDKPKHGDTGSYRSRNALWRAAKKVEPSESKHKAMKSRDVCKRSPDSQHAFAEYMLTDTFFWQDGTKTLHFILSCVYCQQRAWHQDFTYDQCVKRVEIPSKRAA